MNTIASFKTFRWAGFFFVIALLASCKDELNDVGLEISPGSNVLVFHDSSLMLHSYTIAMEDTIRINPANLIAGYMIDPRLGVFQNNFMAEVKTLAKLYDFGTNPVADSVVLFLHYTSINGDTLTKQTLAFYELNKANDLVGINNKPYSDATVNQYLDTTFLGNFTFIPPDTVTVFHIKLPQTLAERLIDPNNVQYYDTVSKFNYYVFRGIYAMAKPLTQGGGTCNFSYSDSTFIKLFYHNTKDTAAYTFYINSSTTKCNLFERSFIFPLQTKPDPALEQDLSYVKSFNGCETRIDITGFKTWADSGSFAFNKAFLTVYSDYTINTIEKQTYPPVSLGIYRIDTSNTKIIVTDYYNSSTGGSYPVGYDTTINAYNIKLTQQLYNSIKGGKDTLSIVLSPLNNLTAPDRMILKGAKNKQMKLNITYTKINN